MSTIIAVKGKDRVYFGFDMAGFNMFSPLDINKVENYPVFSLPEVPNSIFCIATKGPEANIIKTSYPPLIGELELIHKEVDFRFVVRKFVPRMREMLTSYTSLRKDSSKTFIPECLFAFGSDLYQIEPNGFVMIIDDAALINDNYNQHFVDGAEGYLAVSNKEEAKSRIINAFKASSKVNFGKNNKIVLIDNLDLKYEIIDLDKEELKKDKVSLVGNVCSLCGEEISGEAFDARPIVDSGVCCTRCYKKFIEPSVNNKN